MRFGEVECAAYSDLALQPDLSPHHVNQLRCDRQTQASASESPGERTVRLGEGFKNQMLFFYRNADARIANDEVQECFIRSCGNCFDSQALFDRGHGIVAMYLV